ncbi:hypothetical protein PAEPH01_0696 [Pancytospora epiphaga]|nr:hypothetical protein PAEPH01_0696 [Pancytospora epiphaga]
MKKVIKNYVNDRSIIRECPVIKGMMQGVFKNYTEGDCPSECLIYHRITYLEHCIERGSVPEQIEELLKDESSQVRKLSQKILAQHGISARSLIDDPAHEIRAAYILKTTNFDDLIESIDDESKMVKICLLRRLQSVNGNCNGSNHDVLIPKEKQEQVFAKLCTYINDRDHRVRLELIKTLNVFSGLSDKFVLSLFDKKNIGLFIYGAEDEMSEIREKLIMSIETFLRKATSNAIFEYLIDMLNDESESVRETVGAVLCRVTACFRLTATKEQYFFILNGIEEDNVKIRNGILRVLSNLCYASVEIYEILAEQRNAEDSVILGIIKRIVRRNRNLFKRNLESIYSYSIFDENPFERGSLKRFYNLKYLSKLVVLHTLSKYYKIDISEPMRRDFKFLSLKLFKKRAKVPIDMIEATRMAVVHLFEEDKCWDDEHFKAFDRNIVLIRFYIELSKAFLLFISSGNRKELIRIFYTFVMKYSKGIEPQGNLLELLGLQASSFSKTSILDYFNNLDFMHIYTHIVMCEFVVVVPERIAVFKHTKALAIFVAFLHYAYSNTSFKFVVEDPGSANTLEYCLSEKVQVVIKNCPEMLSCYIVAKYNDELVRMSNIGLVNIDYVE